MAAARNTCTLALSSYHTAQSFSFVATLVAYLSGERGKWGKGKMGKHVSGERQRGRVEVF